MDKWKRSSRLSFVQFLGIAGCCVAAAGVMGCFLQPMPGDVEGLADGDAVEERSVGELLDPAMEEFIRPIGDPEEDFIDDADEVADLEVLEEDSIADLIRDGRVDEQDIATFQQEFGNFAAQEDGEEIAADLDGDGVVTLVDFQMFLDLVAPQEEE